MLWFFIGLIGPFIYAITNHIDKFLLEKYFKTEGVGTLLLFSSLLSILALPILYVIEPDILNVSLFNAAFLCLIAVLDLLVLLFYFKALQHDEASVVIVFYQLVPVFGIVLGFLVLGEVLSNMQILAALIIMFGTTIISFEVDEEYSFFLRKETVLFMLGASFCWALEATLFKMVALEENVLQTLFWNNVVLVLLGIILLTFVRVYRDHFIRAFKDNSRAIISLNVANESLYMLGNTAVSFAAIMAPIALILLLESFQAIFVLVIGVLLTLFAPQISQEKIGRMQVIQKLIAITITGVGTYLLLSVT